MADKNDIIIGKDRWISWINFDSTGLDLFPMDALLEPTWQFWIKLQTECVAECCGISAFVFEPGDIQNASEGFDKKQLVSDMSSLKKSVLDCTQQIVESSQLNNLFDKSVFIQLLDHIISCLQQDSLR